MQLTGSIIVELTRWCNKECSHCLRGPRQRKNQTYQNMREFLGNFKYVESVTLTGGEPSLASEQIGLFIDACRNLDLRVGNYYIATNAHRITQKFLNVWDRLHHWCDDNDISHVDISNDEFHEGNRDEHRLLNFAELHDLPCAKKYEKRNGYFYTPTCADCISEGRAKDWSEKKVEKTPFLYTVWGEDNLLSYTEGELYLNCKGNVVHGCDWSFKSQDLKENIIAHVSEFKPEMLIELGKNDD